MEKENTNHSSIQSSIQKDNDFDPNYNNNEPLKGTELQQIRELLKRINQDFSEISNKVTDKVTDKVIEELSIEFYKLQNYDEKILKKLTPLSNTVSFVSNMSESLRMVVEDIQKNKEVITETTKKYNSFFENTKIMLDLMHSINSNFSKFNLEEVLEELREANLKSSDSSIDNNGTFIRSIQKLLITTIRQNSICKIMGFNFSLTTIITINFFISLICVIYIGILSFSINFNFNKLNNKLNNKLSNNERKFEILKGVKEFNNTIGFNN